METPENFESDDLIKYPCDFPIKIMGKATPEFEGIVMEIVHRHCPNLGEGAVKLRPSSGGKYVSITVTFIAQSRAQLDALYCELSGHEQVHMVL